MVARWVAAGGLAAVVLAAAGCGGASSGDGGAAPRGILLITVDGLMAEHVGALGGRTPTPHLDAWIEAGRHWARARSAATQSTPSLATYLTGLAPDRHGVRGDLSSPLPAEIPTLAERLAAAGYATAAFPDSSLLGATSGLLRGFEVVDHPPLLPLNAGRSVPLAKPSAEIAANYRTWIESLPAEKPHFAWLHFSTPAVATLFVEQVDAELDRLKSKAKRRKTVEESVFRLPNALAAIDSAIGSIQETLGTRGGGRANLVLLAGTFGDTSGGQTDPPGPGFSVAEAALQVPVVIVGAPEGWRKGEAAVWSPDIPATIASAAGVALGEQAEGVPLQQEAGANRALFSFAWAGRDQIGIRSSRLAWSAGETAYRGPLGDRHRDTALGESLAARAEPPAPRVPVEVIAPWLESKGFALRPVPEAGRVADPQIVRRATRLLWQTRWYLNLRQNFRALEAYKELVEIDPDNMLGLVEYGQTFAGDVGDESALKVALELYPDNPEAIHWYAHSIWKDALPDAAMLIEMIRPVREHDGDVLYDLACVRSLDGFLDESAEFLRRAIDAGYRRWDHMETDPDLRELRQTGLFSEVMQEYGR